MTLVVAVNSPETIYLMADRQLSFPDGRVLKSDARKQMELETDDGIALLGYAGLGATANGTEPADWMSAVLRGRRMPLEEALGVLAEAIKRELPAHLSQIRGAGEPSHKVIVSAFRGHEVRFYRLVVERRLGGREFELRWDRVVTRHAPAKLRAPRVMLAGSGADHLARDTSWLRPLLRVVRAADRGKVAAEVVADQLAGINNQVQGLDAFVGPRCIVRWRHRRAGVHGGAGHQVCYTGITRERGDGTVVPIVANGLDVGAIARLLMNATMENIRAGRPPFMDSDEVDAEIAKLPDKPDGKLR